MKKSYSLLPLALLPFLCLAQNALVIKNISVIDIKNSIVKKNQTVLIEGNKITTVGVIAKIPASSKIIDGKDRFLIPGLWDMHAHTLTDKRYVYTFPLLIANGVTGVREMASNLSIEEVNQIRKDVENGKMLGPRFGALAYRLFDGPGTQFSNVAVIVSTPEEGRELVRTYKQSGADFIKPYNLLSRDVYLAIVDEAKKQKILIEGHVPFSMTAAEVSDLKQKTIEHNFDVLVSCSKNETDLRKELHDEPSTWGRIEARASEVYDKQKAHELYKQFIRNGTWSCPTIITYRPLRFTSDSALMQDSLLRYVPKSVCQDWHKTFLQRISNVPDPAMRKTRDEMRMFIVGDMYRSGVQLLAGTDMPVPYVIPGFSLHQELELLVESGLTNIDALRTATLNPAKFLEKEKDFGTVEKGKIADLVLLDANPLENISNTKKIFAVILNGKLLERKDLDQMLDHVQELANK